jgi:hypothetical protein
VTDGNVSNGNQVFDLAAVHAAKDPTSTTRLTPALFEAAGVSVVERPPSKDDLVPTKSPSSKSEILRQGAEAIERLSSDRSRDWADWRKVLAALEIGRHEAMLEAGVNTPRGYRYCTAFAKWLRCHEAFQAIDQADRKRMFDCLDNLGAIEEWRARLAPSQQLKWNNPIIVLREWRRSQRPAPEPPAPESQADTSPAAPEPPAPLLAPTELRRQLELLGPARFRKEIMPPDWLAALSDTVLSLASPNQLIATLERKLAASRGARAALKSLRKSLLPNS